MITVYQFGKKKRTTTQDDLKNKELFKTSG